jgi:hypothetical protein
MATEAGGPVWIDPPKYWSAIHGKSDDEVEKIWAEILSLLQAGRIDLVSKIDFVTCVGYPYKGRPFSPAA